MARFFSRSTNQQAAQQAVPNAQQAPQDPRTHYNNLRRSPAGVANTKQTTSDALLNLAQSRNSREQKFATDVVRNLLDFKAAEYAKQRTGESEALNQLRQTIARKPNAAQVTYDECLQLVKNTSSVFKRKLPDTIRNLTAQLLRLHLPSPGIVTERNRTFLDRCELRATPAHARQEILRSITSAFAIFKQTMRSTSPAQCYTYPQLLDAAVGDLNRGGGATSGSGDNEGLMCEQPMRLGRYTDQRPPLQVAAEYMRTTLQIKSRNLELTPRNIGLRSNQFVLELAERERPGKIAQEKTLVDVLNQNLRGNDLRRRFVPLPPDARKRGSLEEIWKQETEQYLRSKQLWRSDDALPNIFTDPAAARAALAACAVVYQKNVIAVLRSIGGTVKMLVLDYSLEDICKGFSANAVSELRQAINNLFNYQTTIKFKGTAPNTFNDSARRMWTRGLYYITSPLMGGEEIWGEEMVPHDFQFLGDRMWIHSAPSESSFSILPGNAPDVGWGEVILAPRNPGQ